MTRSYLVDGDVVPADEATVQVDDRGFLYGDAAFETIRIYGGNPFEWDRHLDRLADTCSLLSLTHDLKRSTLRTWVDEVLEANAMQEGAIRLSITRGVQPGVLSPRDAVDPTVVILVRPLPRGGINGNATWEDPAMVKFVETQKIPSAALPARAKTHNYLNGILARLELDTEDEAILLDGAGRVTEGTISNLFIVDGDGIKTPPLHRDVLPGITRALTLEMADMLDIPTEEVDLWPDDLLEADEVFMTNTTSEIRPIDQIDGTPIDTGSITDRLRKTLLERIEEKHY